MSPSEVVSLDPCTGETVWRGRRSDIDAAVQAARPAFAAWARASLEARIDVAVRFREQVLARADEVARLISRETGKPFWEARTEAASVAAKVDVSIAAYQERTGSRSTALAGMRQTLQHRPHGVLGVLGPFNFPAHLPNGHIVPALLAGNAVVFKPSKQAPGVGAMLGDLWRAAGLPDGVLQVVVGGRDVGEALVAHPGLDGLLFTGSAQAGASFAKQFAATPHRILALEMGGNNPIVAWDIEDVEAAAGLVVQSAFLSAGQRCTAARRLIVERARAAPLIEAIVALTDRLILDAPFADPQPFLGPVVDNAAASQIVDAYRRLEGDGGRVVRPLNRRAPDRPFLSPAIVDVSTVAARSDDEVFGPLLQLVQVDDFDAALSEANATRFGLAAALIGGDRPLFDRFWDASRAGIVNWNRPTTGAASNAPFGGVGLSGNNRPSAYYAADYCAWPVAGLEAEQPVLDRLTGVREHAA